MFAARGLAISFSVFVLVYCALSLAVCITWRRLRLYSQKHTVRRTADLLFALRMFPLVAAAVITIAFTVPSFLLLEPRSIQEPIGEIPLALGICGALLGIFGIVNCAMALRRASTTISSWMKDSQPFAADSSVPVLRISRAVPPMTAAGIAHPKVLLSSAAEFVLSSNELKTALNHEIEHVRRRDNLKKLLMRFVSFPGMKGLEAAWLEATEMAADDAAVSDAGQALDLAAAIIKLSRLSPVEEPADLTAALVHSPAYAMNARVERLLTWNSTRRSTSPRISRWYAVAATLATITVFAFTYSPLLAGIHEATEWLVR